MNSQKYIKEDIEKKVKELQIKCNNLDSEIQDMYQEQYEQMGGDEEEESEITPSVRNILEEELSDTSILLEKYTEILDKINQSEEFSKEKNQRIVRNQRYTSVDDRLNRRDKAKEIAEIIESRQAKTVGIFGAWGTGKSTFLQFIREELIEKCNKEKIRIVDIKATEYSDQEQIWAYLFSKMRESTKNSIGLRFGYLLLRLWKGIGKCLASIAYILAVVALIVILFKYNLFGSFCLLLEIDPTIADNINSGMNWFVSFLFIIKWIIPFASKIRDTVEIPIKNFSEFAKREVNDKLGYKVIVKEYIQELLFIWKKSRFIFMVDELDRCNNKAIMSFLEAIQLLEEFESVQIIYAIDSDIVLNAIKESGIHNPSNYLKKYVDLQFDLFSINLQGDDIKAIAKDEYNFNEKEISKIQLALEEIEVNISVRDYIHILNKLSELRLKWIREEVITEKCKIEQLSEQTLNWYNSLPIAVAFFAGSVWPRRVYNDFKTFKGYIKVYSIARNREIEGRYEECPAFIKQARLIDVLNVVKMIQNTPYLSENAG